MPSAGPTGSSAISAALSARSTSSTEGSLAAGRDNTADGDGSTAIGTGNVADGDDGSAFGSNNAALGVRSLAAGYRSTTLADESVAFGAGAQALFEGDVALGSGSVTAAAVGTSGVTIGGTFYNFAGTAPLSTVSVGAAGAERTITNVAAGQISASSTDAINGSQLYATNQAIAALSSGGGGATHFYSVGSSDSAAGNYNNDGASGADALAAGVNASAAGAGATAVGSGATAGGTSSVAIGQGATAGNANSVALGAGATTAAAVGTAGTTIRGVDYAFAGASPVGTVSVGDVGAERTVTNVAAGRISASSTDAINGSQLYATNQAIETLETGIGELNEFTVKYDTNPDGTKSNTVTLIGSDPNAPVLISNVAAGVKDTDAVNVGQLNEGLGNTLVEANSYTDNRTTAAIQTANNYTNQMAAQTLNQANAYTDYRFSQFNQDISAARTEARQGAAIGLAAASLRYDDRPGKASVAVGGGYWRGEGAFAVGAGYTSENGRMRSNLSGTTAGGDWGVGAGLSFTLN